MYYLVKRNNKAFRGAQVAQSINRLTSAQVTISQFVGLIPRWALC